MTSIPDPDHQAEFYDGVATKRALAWVVDVVLVALLTTGIVIFTAFTALFVLPLVYLMVDAIYRWATISGGSATPGMRLMAIEFRRFDGARLDAGTAFLHTLGYLVSYSMVLPQVLSAAMMAFGGRGKGLSDTVLGTVAINRPSRW